MEKNPMYPNRNLVDLDALIEKRAKKVEDLKITERTLLANGDHEALAKHHERMDEYAAVVYYLRTAKEVIFNGN